MSDYSSVDYLRCMFDLSARPWLELDRHLAFLNTHAALGLTPDTLLEGLQVRRSIPVPDEVTDSADERVAKALRRAAGERKWAPWKTISGWKISTMRLRDLGPVWTEDTEYRRP